MYGQQVIPKLQTFTAIMCRKPKKTDISSFSLNSGFYWGTAVAQWLRCCATNQKLAGSIPAGVSGFFIDIKCFRSHYGPGIDSASNRNEYQQYFLGVKSGRCVRLTTYHHPAQLSCNLGTLTSWNPLGHSRPVTGLIYLFPLASIVIFFPFLVPYSFFSFLYSSQILDISRIKNPRRFSVCIISVPAKSEGSSCTDGTHSDPKIVPVEGSLI